MTGWAILLLASVLLDTPGFPPSEYYDPRPFGPCEGDPFCRNLAEEGLEGALLVRSKEALITCSPCTKIIQKLQTLVGDDPNEDNIKQAASQVCSRMGLLKKPCSYVIKKFLRRISKDILEGKSARDICVDLKMCSPKPGVF